MNSPLALSAHNYRTLRERLLQDMPELEDDPECLLNTLEGITDTNEQIAALLRSALTEQALAKGIDEYVHKLSDRKLDLLERANRKRKIALHYMTDLNIRKVTAPDMTATVKRVPPSVVIINDEIIPDAYMRIKREPNKTAIKDALDNGDKVPGCTLSNGNETLSVRV